MQRQKPKLSYCGLTIVMSNPSRLDLKSGNLLSGISGGKLFADNLGPDFNIFQCDIRLKEHKEALLPNTKCVLLLGEPASQEWLKLPNTIGELRGSVYVIDNVPHISTFFPQDCADIKDYEATHNPLHQQEAEVDEDSHSALDQKRAHGRTQRKNYAFWLMKDMARVKTILKSGIPERPKPVYEIYPNADVVIDILKSTKNEKIFIDFETDGPLQHLCFSFSVGQSDIVYSVPVVDYNYNWAYSNLPFIYNALAIAARDNTLIAHNGACFDFFLLAYKYHINLYKLEDTMLMMNRCFPEVEKSLGHVVSLFTWESFHKDEGSGGYNNSVQMENMLRYCAKDVWTMKLAYYAMLDYAKARPGLQASFDQVNASIKPYLLTTLTGIKYDEDMRKSVMKENDRLMMQYNRIINLLIGETTAREFGRRFKSSLASSNPQCCEYFHNLLGYPVVGHGKEKKDGTKGPSLAKKNMFKLKLQFDNPVIDLIIAYREVMKESGSLKFNPYKSDENKSI